VFASSQSGGGPGGPGRLPPVTFEQAFSLEFPELLEQFSISCSDYGAVPSGRRSAVSLATHKR
jgi:hypothetical protein